MRLNECSKKAVFQGFLKRLFGVVLFGCSCSMGEMGMNKKVIIKKYSTNKSS